MKEKILHAEMRFVNLAKRFAPVVPFAWKPRAEKISSGRRTRARAVVGSKTRSHKRVAWQRNIRELDG